MSQADRAQAQSQRVREEQLAQSERDTDASVLLPTNVTPRKLQTMQRDQVSAGTAARLSDEEKPQGGGETMSLGSQSTAGALTQGLAGQSDLGAGNSRQPGVGAGSVWAAKESAKASELEKVIAKDRLAQRQPQA